MASWEQWGGGACYSARLILPVVPFLFVPLVVLTNSKTWQTDWFLRICGATLMLISIWFGAIAAFERDYVVLKHPLEMLF
jgi:hypothetical protein